MQEAVGPVELSHAGLDVRREVEGAEKLDGVIVRGEDLGELEGEHAAVGVACDGVGPCRLYTLDVAMVGGHCVLDAAEEGLALLDCK